MQLKQDKLNIFTSSSKCFSISISTRAWVLLPPAGLSCIPQSCASTPYTRRKQNYFRNNIDTTLMYSTEICIRTVVSNMQIWINIIRLVCTTYHLFSGTLSYVFFKRRCCFSLFLNEFLQWNKVSVSQLNASLLYAHVLHLKKVLQDNNFCVI